MIKEGLQFIYSPLSYLRFVRDFARFRAQSRTRDGFSARWLECYPCLGERTERTGFDKHYIFHTAWAARILVELKPREHVDISSSLYFVAIASAFTPMRYYEYRPADLGLSNLECASADLLSLPFGDGTIESLSCMHVVEHVGLGRYGDPLDPDGDLRAIAELKRVLAAGGHLLFVVPIGGRPRMRFNAHRIYTYDQIAACFSDLELKEFALILDKGREGGLVRNASRELADQQKYGCGCFCFHKMAR